MERTTHKSSTHWDVYGKRLLTGIPLCPCWRNGQGHLRTVPTLLNCVGGVFILIGWPCSLARRGFGSKVSTCDGPPSMNRKMTLRALGLKCGGRGANGSFSKDGIPKAESFKSAARATAPNPLAHWRNMSRRDSGEATNRPQ